MSSPGPDLGIGRAPLAARVQPALPAFLPKSTRAEFVCARCGHRAPAVFTDPAAFSEDEPLPGRNRWAQEAALASANRKLDKAAQRALSMARCPACGARDARGLRRGYLWAALPLVGLVPAAFMITIIAVSVLLPQLSAALRPAIAAGVTLLLSGLVVLRGRRRLLREADGAVRFLPAAAAPSP